MCVSVFVWIHRRDALLEPAKIKSNKISNLMSSSTLRHNYSFFMGFLRSFHFMTEKSLVQIIYFNTYSKRMNKLNS